MKQINITDYLRNKKETIKSTNGKSYKVLKQKNKYLLLENLSHSGDGNDKFVVAYNLYPDKKSWQHGEYFGSQKEAMQYFETK